MTLPLGARLQLRAATFESIRSFFAQRGVLEVDVPTLMPAPVTDPSIDVPVANSPDGTHLGYLQSSPEYALKRLLAAGAPDCYCLGHVFRSMRTAPATCSNFRC